MNLVRIVRVSFQMTLHHGLQRVSLNEGSGERTSIQEHLANVLGEGITVPHTVVIELVSPKK